MEDNNINADAGWDINGDNGFLFQDPGATSTISSIRSKTGVYSLQQVCPGNGNGTRIYRYPEITSNWAAHDIYISYWIWIDSVIEYSVGAGDWGGPFVQVQSESDINGIVVPLWLFEIKPRNAAGDMQPYMTWWGGVGHPANGPHNGESGTRNYTPFDTALRIPAAQWVFMEHRIKSSDAFAGEVLWWINGVEVLWDIGGSPSRIVNVKTKFPEAGGHGGVMLGNDNYGAYLGVSAHTVWKDDFKISFGRPLYS